MVQVLPYVPSFGNRLGAVLGEALGDIGSSYMKNRVLENELSQLKQAGSPQDLATSLVRLSSRIPGSERYIAPLYQTLLSQMNAQKSLNLPLAGELGAEAAAVSQAPTPATKKASIPVDNSFREGKLPSFGDLNGANLTPAQKTLSQRFFPNNVGAQEEGGGNAPQQATSGQVRPVYTIEQLSQQARQLAAARTKMGIPTTPQQALEEVKQANEENKAYNVTVEQERQARIQAQRDYGKIGKEILGRVLPEATDEQKSVFAKMAENAVGENQSEADIERLLSKQATNFKNTLANIRQDLSAPRVQNALQRKFLGTEKDFQEASHDLRVKTKPLLDLGLYDTARKELTQLGYYPEEVESIINPLDQRTLTFVKTTPEAKKIRTKQPNVGIGVAIPTSSGVIESYAEGQQDQLKDSLEQILKQNPNTSLVLLRKEFENKNYDWRLFKNALNDLISDEKVKLNDDQANQLKYLDTPPLNALEKLLHNLKIIGR